MNFSVLFAIVLISGSWSLPPHQRRFSDQEFNDIVEHEKPKDENSHTNTSALDELGIEYTRYLQQVVDLLEKDESFKKKLESAAESDIKTAKIAEELEYVNHHIRSKLDELKRTELQRLRELAKQAYGNEHDFHLNPPGHLDHENSDTFEVKDLKKLIYQVAQDLEETDKKRKQMFKQYEMEKHFEREQKLQSMNEEEKKKFLHVEEEAKKKEEEAKKRVHHPGSKQQLEEVWEEQDHMSKSDFDPKTFFVMHDVDGNGFLDEEEVKSLFLKELDKLYAQGMPQADLMERAEEMERMREHVFKEVDKNRDRLISWEEFYAMSLKPEFNEDPGWKPIDDQPVYSQEELLAFERQRLFEIEQLKREGKLPPDYHVPVLHDQMNNSFYAYQPGVNDPNIHPAYYQQVPMQQPLHPQDAIHAQQQQYQQYQHQQFQQQQQQFQPVQPQQLHQQQFQPVHGIPQQPGVVPQANFAQPVAHQNVYQPHAQPPVVSQQTANLVQQPANAVPQQPIVSQPPASAPNVYQPQAVFQQGNAAQQPSNPQQLNVPQQAANIPQQSAAANQAAYQAQPLSYQAAPQHQPHLETQKQGEPSHDRKAPPIVNNKIQTDNKKVRK